MFRDYANYYSRDTLGEFLLVAAPAAVFANSDFDADVGNWYQEHIRSDSTNRAAAFFRPLGNGYYTIPVYVSAKLLGEYFDDRPDMPLLGEFGDRATRALLVALRRCWPCNTWLAADGRQTPWTNPTGDHFAAPMGPADMPSWARCRF